MKSLRVQLAICVMVALTSACATRPANRLPNAVSICDQLIQGAGDESLLALGETHGTREFSEFKTNCVKRLVSEKNYTMVAIEAGLAETSWINDFIQNGNDTPKELVKSLPYLFNTAEFVDLIFWLRDYKIKTGRNIEMVGFDFQNSKSSRAILKTFFKKWDPEYLSKLETASGAEVHAQLVKITESNQNISKNGAYPWALKNAQILTQNEKWKGEHEQSLRDQLMAENLDWHLNQDKNKRKVIVWAHNFHIAHDNQGVHSMGYFLEHIFKLKLNSVGFFFGKGSFLASTFTYPDRFQSWVAQDLPESSIEYMLREQGAESLYLRIQKNSFPITPTQERSIGWAKLSSDFSRGTPLLEYEGFIYFSESSPLVIQE